MAVSVFRYSVSSKNRNCQKDPRTARRSDVPRKTKPVYRVSINPIPGPLMERNLRTVLPQRQWQSLRSEALAASGGICARCEMRVRPAAAMHAHEEWSYKISGKSAVARL